MSGGQKNVVINTQERAVSVDINRLQSFTDASWAELMRYWVNGTGDDDVNAGSVIAEFSSIGTPLRAEIFNGLLVRPQTGSSTLLVDAGVLMAIAPDGAPDDSVYKYINDPGVTNPAQLTTTPNGAGTIRIDVVEVQVAYFISETDNRDIFNPITGLFTATNVTKATQGDVTKPGNIRVRLGVAGVGFPGTVAGWLPLAVLSVPAGGGATNDTIAFWDVRPLISDRLYGPSALTNSRPKFDSDSMINATTLATTTGLINVTYNGRRLGGRLRSGSAGVADADSIDVSAAANQQPGIVFTANMPWYLYFLTPYELPRWARYTTSGARLPRSPRGIPVVSMTDPDSDGNPTAPITPPLVTGLVTPTSSAIAAIAGFTTPAAAQGGVFGDNAMGFILSDSQLNAEPLEVAGVVAGVGTSDVNGTWTLTSGTHFPPHARELLIDTRFTLTATAVMAFNDCIVDIQTFAPNAGPLIHRRPMYNMGLQSLGIGAQYTPRGSSWVQVPGLYPAVAGYTLQFRMSVRSTPGIVMPNLTPSAVGLRVLGWRF